MAVIRSSLILLILVLSSISGIHGTKCQCHCHVVEKPICDSIDDLMKITTTNTEKLLQWEKIRPFLQRFSERWRSEIAAIVETKMAEYIANGNFYSKPEALMSNLEDGIQNDFPMVPIASDGRNNVVSNILAKVERVENRTIEVEKELKSERRVRRHLEQEVKDTQSSLISLQNVTVPVDTMMNRVEMVIHSSLEDMNKTIYEEHLKKLYYQVDGVVYKNETKKLDERLESVETELNSIDNSSIVSKLAEDFKLLEESLYLLNTSIGENLVPRVEAIDNSIGDVLLPRLESLEVETVRKNDTEELEVKLENLLNGTELFRISLADVLADIQDIQDFKKNFENFTDQWSTTLKKIQSQVEFLKNDSLNLKRIGQTDDTDELNDIFQQKLIGSLPEEGETTASEDYEDDYPDLLPLIAKNASEVPESGTNFERSATDAPEASLNVFGTWEPEVPQDVNESTADDYQTETPTTLVTESTTGEKEIKSIASDVGRIDEGFDSSSCGKPDIKDDHLLVDVVTDPYGNNQLKFGCRPIGLYAVSYLPVPPRCEGGSWKGPFPFCKMLPNISSIEDEELQTLMPPILIKPDNLDRPGSHLGTGSYGQLIVHPRSSFTFECLYPENTSGYPKWSVTYTSFAINRRNLIPKESQNKVSITVTAATEEDSGVYKCLTPFGVQHSVEVVVKAVTCPAFTLDEEYEDVFYRPTPEGELRIIGTRAEFQCDDGHRILRQCMANGSWSSGIPSDDECELKKRRSDGIWNCNALDVSKHPDLILERINAEKIIMFKCSGGKKLIGNSFTRCREDGLWTYTSLPKCM